MIMNPNILDRYEMTPPTLRHALAGLTPHDLAARPVPETWSIHQIVIHLMDSDLIWTDRAKRIIAEENPTLIGYDEAKFAANLFYEQQSIDDALTIFELNRRQFAIVLRQLPSHAFQRVGTHNQRGQIRLAQSIESVNTHVDHHLQHLLHKRALLGKPLA